MRLRQLIKSLGSYSDCLELNDFEIRGISSNSCAIKDNFVFVAIKGAQEDGHKFIQEAINRGAKAVITQYPISSDIKNPKKNCFIRVADSRKALAELAAEFYGRPSSKIKVIGVTGTNGKTTVSYLIEALLKEAGKNPGVIGTVNYRFKDKVIPAKNTTPGPIELESLLADMLKGGVDYLVMEVSSHALDQGRIEGIDFHCAIFTNLTGDHLDYHKTKKNYFSAKAKLFKNINSHSFAVINNDDKYGRKLKDLIPKNKVITYGLDNSADYVAKNINFDIAHTEFILSSHKSQTLFKTKLIGLHNVYNILSAAAWAFNEGLDLSTIQNTFRNFSLVPGRLERINFRDFVVFVDYAHTEDALKNVIQTLRQISRKRIIVVFGCGGERDKTKRPNMGYAASELADYAIITNDNPRSEDPKKIIEDIKKGILKDNYFVIPDRGEAIKKALSLAKADDTVLIAGKGHEDYQILKDKRVHFDDREIVRECLKSMNY